MRRPVGVKWIRLFFRWTCFSSAEWPLTPCFHPHSQGAIRIARCMLGVLVSAGAAICLAPCGSALSESNLGQAINAVTGTRLWAFVFSFLGTILFLRPYSSDAAARETAIPLPNQDFCTPPARTESQRFHSILRLVHWVRGSKRLPRSLLRIPWRTWCQIPLASSFLLVVWETLRQKLFLSMRRLGYSHRSVVPRFPFRDFRAALYRWTPRASFCTSLLPQGSRHSP